MVVSVEEGPGALLPLDATVLVEEVVVVVVTRLALLAGAPKFKGRGSYGGAVAPEDKRGATEMGLLGPGALLDEGNGEDSVDRDFTSGMRRSE